MLFNFDFHLLFIFKESFRLYKNREADIWTKLENVFESDNGSVIFFLSLPEKQKVMLAYTYIEKGRFSMLEKPVPELKDPCDALVRVTLGSICTSDLHIKHGSVPRAVPGITVGHEMVGIVEQVGSGVTTVKPGDRVTVNVETFCGECFSVRKDM